MFQEHQEHTIQYIIHYKNYRLVFLLFSRTIRKFGFRVTGTRVRPTLCKAKSPPHRLQLHSSLPLAHCSIPFAVYTYSSSDHISVSGPGLCISSRYFQAADVLLVQSQLHRSLQWCVCCGRRSRAALAQKERPLTTDAPDYLCLPVQAAVEHRIVCAIWNDIEQLLCSSSEAVDATIR